MLGLLQSSSHGEGGHSASLMKILLAVGSVVIKEKKASLQKVPKMFLLHLHELSWQLEANNNYYLRVFNIIILHKQSELTRQIHI